MIRRLCAELGAERVFTKTSSVVVAAASTGEPSALAFAAAMTEALNVILLTSPECAKMRATLGGDDGDDAAKALFAALYPCWCHGAVATVALCLLCVADAHAAAVVTSLCDHESEITLRALVQIDQLVKLIESPVFARLRMRLLTPARAPGRGEVFVRAVDGASAERRVSDVEGEARRGPRGRARRRRRRRGAVRGAGREGGRAHGRVSTRSSAARPRRGVAATSRDETMKVRPIP